MSFCSSCRIMRGMLIDRIGNVFILDNHCLGTVAGYPDTGPTYGPSASGAGSVGAWRPPGFVPGKVIPTGTSSDAPKIVSTAAASTSSTSHRLTVEGKAAPTGPRTSPGARLCSRCGPHQPERIRPCARRAFAHDEPRRGLAPLVRRPPAPAMEKSNPSSLAGRRGSLLPMTGSARARTAREQPEAATRAAPRG